MIPTEQDGYKPTRNGMLILGATALACGVYTAKKIIVTVADVATANPIPDMRGIASGIGIFIGLVGSMWILKRYNWRADTVAFFLLLVLVMLNVYTTW